MKIQTMKSLFEEMRAVARGDIPAPADAADASVESVEVLVRLLTSDNRHLLSVIRDCQPQSIAELSRLTKRAEPNLLRTLSKLEAAGFVEMKSIGRRRVPRATIQSVTIKIDPFAMRDQVETVKA